MKEIKLKPENLQKAWDEGCDSTKKALENIAPDYKFKKKIKFSKQKVYAFSRRGEIYKLIDCLSSRYLWSRMGNTYNHCYGLHFSTNEALESAKEKVEVFDNEKDFFKWALKQVE